MADLLTAADLPNDFAYPGEFVRTAELGLTSFEPWWIPAGRAAAASLGRAKGSLSGSGSNPLRRSAGQ